MSRAKDPVAPPTRSRPRVTSARPCGQRGGGLVAETPDCCHRVFSVCVCVFFVSSPQNVQSASRAVLTCTKRCVGLFMHMCGSQSGMVVEAGRVLLRGCCPPVVRRDTPRVPSPAGCQQREGDRSPMAVQRPHAILPLRESAGLKFMMSRCLRSLTRPRAHNLVT
jgi:hypothetical protein